MLDIQGRRATLSGKGMRRRDFVRIGALATGGLTVADWLRLKAQGGAGKYSANSVIQLWMAGGPSHLDTFDPKPEAGADFCGPYRHPIETNVSGIRIGEMLPLLAKCADKYSIIRSMTHGEYGHETATYIMQTCTMPGELAYPSVGAVVAYKRREAGYQGLPPYMAIHSPPGWFAECGFLGNDYRVVATGGSEHPSAVDVKDLAVPGQVSEERLPPQRSLLEAVDSLARQMENNRQLEAMGSYQQRAYGMILGEAKRAFHLAEEPTKVRDRYGQNYWGQSCLLARRLVERGVPFITINWGGWDTHRDHFGRMKELLPPLDRAFSALLEDLAQRGLLETTIVTWFGEFGRTPKIDPKPPWDGGRHHYGPVTPVVVAGGGFKGGIVVGQSDAKGELPANRTVYPWDLSASMYTLLGIDPDGRLPHPSGCAAQVTPQPGGDLRSGGLLSEIM